MGIKSQNAIDSTLIADGKILVFESRYEERRVSKHLYNFLASQALPAYPIDPWDPSPPRKRQNRVINGVISVWFGYTSYSNFSAACVRAAIASAG